MNIQDNDFDLFGLPMRFEQTSADLEQRWKRLQGQVHPDRFAAQGGAAQRLAMQWSARVNQAYQRLRDPLRRAAYLCELKGAALDAEKNTAMPASFLMQQMHWREMLDEANSVATFSALTAEVAAERERLLQACAAALDDQNDAKAAAEHVRSLMFLERILHEADERQQSIAA
jgi:molecular chaperone HscB